MIQYQITVYINDGSKSVLEVKYEKEYELRSHVISIGINGLLQKAGNKYQYFPPNRIDKIEVEEITP